MLPPALIVSILADAPARALDHGPVVWETQKLDTRDFDRPFTRIAAGGIHTMVLKSEGSVVAWGKLGVAR